MIKILRSILLILLIVSCNSNKKESEEISANNTEPIIENQKSSALQASIKEGKFIYNDFCITCHMGNGKGVPKAFPPVANSDYLKNNQEASIMAVKKGMSGEIVVNGITYNSVMAPLGLSNEEVADVMNYINHSWGNDYAKIITPQEVAKITE